VAAALVRAAGTGGLRALGVAAFLGASASGWLGRSARRFFVSSPTSRDLGRVLAHGQARLVGFAALTGFQVFRVPVEWVLFALHRDGVAPVQMSFEGWNFDVLTGLSAPFVAWLAARGVVGRRGLLAWNCAGLALLANIVGIAVLSTPTPLRAFGTGGERSCPWP
jgi:hypothetical protein